MKIVRVIVVLTIVFFLCKTSNSQSTFQASYNCGSGHLWSSIRTFDGNVAFIGSTSFSGAGNADVSLIKMDNDGNLVWAKTYGDTSNDIGYSVTQTPDSGYMICGQTQSFGVGNTHIYVIRTDSEGNLIWSNVYDANHDCTAKSIVATNDGGYVMTGSSLIWGSMREEIYLLKIDSTGALVWDNLIGNTYNDAGNHIEQTHDGGFIITGVYDYSEFFLIRTDSIGDTLWTRIYGYPLQNAQYVTEAPDSGFIVVGGSAFIGNFTYGSIMKTDSSGNLEWANLYGTSGNDGFYSATLTDENQISAVGYTSSTQDMFLVNVNLFGDTLFTRAYGDSLHQYAYSIHSTSDKGSILTGGYENDFFYILKIDSLANTFCNQRATNTVISNPQVLTYTPPMDILPVNTFVSPCQSITGNGGGINSICTSVGIKDFVKTNFNLFPNPATNKFFLTGCLNDSEVEMYDMLGNLVHKETAHSTSLYEIRISQLPAGIYSVKIFDNRSEAVRLLIKHD